MNADSVGVPLGLWLVPLALLVTVGGLFMLARRLQKRSLVTLEQLRAEDRRFEVARQEIGATVRIFAGDLQEPFHSRIAELQSMLEMVDRQSSDLRSRRVAINQQANNLRAAQFKAIIGAPWLWYLLLKDANSLRREMEAAWGGLNAAGQKEAEIRRLGWDIARQARQTRKLEEQVRSALDSLRAYNLQGDAAAAARATAGQVRSDLDKLPNYLFTGNEADLLVQVDRDTIVQAHTVIQSVHPELEKLQAQVQAWEKALGHAGEAVERLERVLDDVENTLANLPSTVDGSESRQKLNAMRQILGGIKSTLSRPEAENLDAVVEEAERQGQFGQEISSALKRARREDSALQSVLAELPAAFKDLALQLATLGSRSVHPVAWRATLDTMTELNRKVYSLGPADRSRLPGQIAEDLKVGADLRARQKDLINRYSQVQEAHESLLSLLSGPELSGLSKWLDEARGLIEKMDDWAPENWSRSENVGSLPAEIAALADESERAALFRSSESIPEDEVAARLDQVRRLIQTYAHLRSRTDAARSRLDELLRLENATQDQLESVTAALGQMDYLADSNDVLAGLAAQEIDRFSDEVKRLAADLEDRSRGRMDHKARTAQSLVERVVSAANRWLDGLIREIGQAAEELSSLLKALDEIVILEEKTVVEARRLLTSGAAGAPGGYGSRSGYSLEALIPELKRRSDAWHACSAAVRALEDFSPLIETFREAEHQRDKASRTLNEAASAIRQKRAWPPTNASFDAEWQELEQLNRQWQEARERGTKAVAHTARLGSLAARYQALADRVQGIAERVARERSDVEELEAGINELAELWQNNLHQYANYPEVSAEIKALLEDLHSLLAQIRRQYIQGSADYAQTFREIKNLHKRVRYYQVALDEDSALDVNGNVHRRRESRRV